MAAKRRKGKSTVRVRCLWGGQTASLMGIEFLGPNNTLGWLWRCCLYHSRVVLVLHLQKLRNGERPPVHLQKRGGPEVWGGLGTEFAIPGNRAWVTGRWMWWKKAYHNEMLAAGAGAAAQAQCTTVLSPPWDICHQGTIGTLGTRKVLTLRSSWPMILLDRQYGDTEN